MRRSYSVNAEELLRKCGEVTPRMRRSIRIVISATMTKPSETKREKKKPAKHSFEFMIGDAT